MKCNNCGAELQSTSTNLPFKVTETSIVIIKGLPVIQCGSCTEYLIEDSVFSRVEEILAGVDSAVELEIIRYAA
jgi:YgiT-type zinc finger domain-containing protein